MLRRSAFLLFIVILFCGCAKNSGSKPQDFDDYGGRHKKILPLPQDEKIFILSCKKCVKNAEFVC